MAKKKGKKAAQRKAKKARAVKKQKLTGKRRRAKNKKRKKAGFEPIPAPKPEVPAPAVEAPPMESHVVAHEEPEDFTTDDKDLGFEESGEDEGGYF